jgi:hypothetical protein
MLSLGGALRVRLSRKDHIDALLTPQNPRKRLRPNESQQMRLLSTESFFV